MTVSKLSTIEYDAVTLSFADAYADSPESALRMLQLLLLDSRLISNRSHFLTALAEHAAPQSPTGEDFSAEINLIVHTGLIAYHRAGKFTPELVHRLHMLTCDPEQLRRAHETLVEPPKAPEIITPSTLRVQLVAEYGRYGIARGGIEVTTEAKAPDFWRLKAYDSTDIPLPPEIAQRCYGRPDRSIQLELYGGAAYDLVVPRLTVKPAPVQDDLTVVLEIDQGEGPLTRTFRVPKAASARSATTSDPADPLPATLLPKSDSDRLSLEVGFRGILVRQFVGVARNVSDWSSCTVRKPPVADNPGLS